MTKWRLPAEGQPERARAFRAGLDQLAVRDRTRAIPVFYWLLLRPFKHINLANNQK
jgi:hypothetical protein